MSIAPFSLLLFLYFTTLHADQLSFSISSYTVRLNNLFALFLLMATLIRFRRSLIAMDRNLAISLLLISLSLATSAILSPYKERCLFFAGWYAVTVSCYFLLPYLLIQFWDKQKILNLYIASFICVGCYALAQLIFSLFSLEDPFAGQRILTGVVRPNAFAYEPSFYALYMTPFIILVNLHFIFSSDDPFYCIKRLTGKKVLFFNALFAVSFSTSLFFVYALLFFSVLLHPSFKKMKKRVFRFLFYCVGVGALLFAAAPFLIKNFFMKFFYFGFMPHHSFYQRWAGIKNSWLIFLEKPIAGVGLGGIPPYLYDSWLSGDERFTFYEKFFSYLPEITLKQFEPMNVMTELLASLGIGGALGFGFLLFIYFIKGKQIWNANSHAALHLWISGAVMLVILQFNQGVLRTYIWCHLGLIFALLPHKASHSPLPLSEQKAL